MAIKLSDLKKDIRAVEIPVGGEMLRVEYHPNAYTPELEEKAQAAMKDSRSHDLFYAMLPPVLHSWDLEQDDGTPLPIDVSGVKQVPIVILTSIMMAITDDLMPKKPSGTDSGGSF